MWPSFISRSYLTAFIPFKYAAVSVGVVTPREPRYASTFDQLTRNFVTFWIDVSLFLLFMVFLALLAMAIYGEASIWGLVIAQAFSFLVMTTFPVFIHKGMLTYRQCGQIFVPAFTLTILLLSRGSFLYVVCSCVQLLPILSLFVSSTRNSLLSLAACTLVPVAMLISDDATLRHALMRWGDDFPQPATRAQLILAVSPIIAHYLGAQLGLYSIALFFVTELRAAMAAMRASAERAERTAHFEALLQTETATLTHAVVRATGALASRPTKEAQGELLALIRSSAEHIRELSASLVPLAAAEVAAMADPVPFDVFGTVEQAVNIIGALAESGRAPLVVRMTADVQYVTGHHAVLRQILTTLLDVSVGAALSSVTSLQVSCKDVFESSRTIALEFVIAGGASFVLDSLVVETALSNEFPARASEVQARDGARLMLAARLLSALKSELVIERGQGGRGDAFKFALVLPVCTKEEYDAIKTPDSDISELLSVVNRFRRGSLRASFSRQTSFDTPPASPLRSYRDSLGGRSRNSSHALPRLSHTSFSEPTGAESLRQFRCSSSGASGTCARCQLPRPPPLVSPSTTLLQAFCKCSSRDLALCRLLLLVAPGSREEVEFVRAAEQWHCAVSSAAPNQLLGSDKDARELTLPHVLEGQSRDNVVALLAEYDVVVVDDEIQQLDAVIAALARMDGAAEMEKKRPGVLFVTELLRAVERPNVVIITKPLKILRALKQAILLQESE